MTDRERIAARFAELNAAELALRGRRPLPYEEIKTICEERLALKKEWEDASKNT